MNTDSPIHPISIQPKPKRNVRLIMVASLLISVTVISAYWYFSHKVAEITSKPSRGSGSPVFAAESSRIGASVQVPLSDLVSTLNSEVPSTYAGGGNGEDLELKVGPVVVARGGTKYDFTVTRTGGFAISSVNAQTIRLTAPISVEGHGGFRGDGARILKVDAKSFSCAFFINADITPHVNPDWTVNSSVNIGYNWISNPRVEIVGGVWADIRTLVQGKIDSSIGSLSVKATEQANKVDIKSAIQKIYATRAIPIEISKGQNIFANISPEEIAFSGFSFSSEACAVAAQIKAKIEINATPIKEVPLPLPNFVSLPQAAPTIDIRVPVHIRYSDLESILKKEVVGKKFNTGPNAGNASVAINDIAIYPSLEGELVIGISVDADTPSSLFDTKGFVYMIATPTVEKGNVVGISDLRYTQTLDNKIWPLLAVLFEGPIREKIKSGFKYDASKDVRDVESKLKESLEKAPPTPGTRIEVKDPKMGVGRLAIGADEIEVEGIFSAEVAVGPQTKKMK